ncbi:MAG TPA: efflux transporter outer membrane subunit [Casimicrobiaceae bacterium]
MPASKKNAQRATGMRTWVIATTLGLSACTVGPNYVRPQAEAPAVYKEAEGWKAAQPRDGAIRGNWWEVFNEPDLDALEVQIDVSNQTLRAAEARVREARALAAQARAALFPTVSADAVATRSGSGSRAGGASGTGSGTSGVRNNFNLALDASWELDLWGRVRRNIESSEASAQASVGDLAAAKLSAHAELAQDYLLLRVQDATIRLLDDTVAAYERSLQLTRNQYAAGVAGRSDVVQAETQLKSTQAQAIDARIERAQLEHAIAILVGKAPAEFSIAVAPFEAKFPSIPTGMPSELLERRPDIAAAERRAAAANAQIGVAEAAFFPAVTLSATGGFQSSVIGNLLSVPSRYWTLGAALTQVVFDAGLRRAQTDQAIAAYDQSVADYRQTVLAAFQDVEDNLVALRTLEQEAAVQDEAVKAARESLAIVVNQYRAGTANYLAVIVIQAAALANERAAISILGRRLTASVALVKALGGGWKEAPASTASEPAKPSG